MIANKIQNNSDQNSRQSNSSGNWYLEGCFRLDSGTERRMMKNSPFTIGRRNTNDCMLSSGNVSGSHAEFVIADDKIFLKDLNSTNGTYVNGHRIFDAVPLGAGDYIQFADMEFRLGQIETTRSDQTFVSDDLQTGWMMSKMCQVIHNQQFHMVFQPIVSAENQSLYGFEALLRCDIPGLQSPIELFQQAVQFGLEEELSRLAREKSVETISGHQHAKRLFLNTHPHEHLGEELIASLKTLTERIGDWKLVIEIHEAAVPDLATMRHFQDTLRDLQIELAYDDFGAGQSRLRELIEVPPTYVKFDRCLVDGISTASPRHVAMVGSFVSLCRESGITPLAEGLDNQEDADRCGEIGFSLYQGYHFGRPMPIDDQLNLLK